MTISKHTYRAEIITQTTLPETVVLTDKATTVRPGPWSSTTLDVTTTTLWADTHWMAFRVSTVLSGTVTRRIVGLTVGRRYTVALNVRRFANATIPAPMIALGDGPSTVATDTWEPRAYSFTATSTEHSVVLKLSTSTGPLYALFDDFSVTAHEYKMPTVATPLSLKDGVVTLDETHSPYASASMTLATPNRATLALLDPRAKARIRITAHQSFGTSQPLSAFKGATLATLSTRYAGQTLFGISTEFGTGYNPEGVRPPTERSFDLLIRSRTIDRVEGTITLTASSDEGLLIDYAPAQTLSTGPTVRAAVALALGRIGALLEPGTDNGTIAGDSPGVAVWPPGMSAWEFVSPLVQSAGLRLYCDEQRRWHLVKPIGTNDIAVYVSEANVTEAIDVMSRDDLWFDAVTVKYSWTDSAGLPQVRYDIAAPPGYSRMDVIEYERKWPGDGAAAAILARASGRGQISNVSLVSDYRAEPGAWLRTSIGDAPVMTGLVSRITWVLTTDSMSIEARDLTETPPYSWLASPVGLRWSDLPAGKPWTSASLATGI